MTGLTLVPSLLLDHRTLIFRKINATLASSTPGINMYPGWSDHKWTALYRYEHASRRCTEIWSLKPHLELFWGQWRLVLKIFGGHSFGGTNKPKQKKKNLKSSLIYSGILKVFFHNSIKGSNTIRQPMEHPRLFSTLTLIMAMQSQLKGTTKFHTVYYSEQDISIFMWPLHCAC